VKGRCGDAAQALVETFLQKRSSLVKKFMPDYIRFVGFVLTRACGGVD